MLSLENSHNDRYIIPAREEKVGKLALTLFPNAAGILGYTREKRCQNLNDYSKNKEKVNPLQLWYNIKTMNILAAFYQNYPWLVWYLIAINLLAFFIYGLDKAKAASNDWRVSERRLLLLALVGGSLGAAAGIKIFRHKTRKNTFLAWFILIILAQLIVLAALIFGLPPALDIFSPVGYN